MKYAEGNLLDMAESNEFDIIIHGCNCFCRMKSGIAGQIALRYPTVVSEDNKTEVGDKSKLGTIVPVFIPKYNFHIINAYTQYMYGTEKQQADYEAIEKCFINIKQKFGRKMGRDLKFGIPKIGCGLAGGKWEIVCNIIDDILLDENVTCVIYKN